MRITEEGLKAKEREYGAVKERLDEMERLNSHLQVNSEFQTDNVKKAGNRQEHYENQIASLRQEIDLLNQDKTFVTRENATMHDRVKRLEDQIDKQHEEVYDAKKNAQQYLERLLNQKDEVRTDTHERHIKEVDGIREKHNRDMEIAKRSLADLYEKKIEYLAEVKEESDGKLLRVERFLKEKECQYDDLMVEYRKIEKLSDQEVGSTKLDLRMKSDELMRVTHLYEDNLMLVKELKVENEAIKQKQDLLKGEYYKLESTCRQKNAEVIAELSVYKERMAHYEAIEKEMDDAIISAAEGSSIDGDGHVMDTLGTAPTASKRRIQQSLALANRLQAKQREVEGLINQNQKLQKEIRGWESKSQMFKRIDDKKNLPYKYLLQDMEKGEVELSMTNQRNTKLSDGNKKLREENEALRVTVSGLKEDLEALNHKRKEIDHLQSTLLSIVRESSTKKVSVDYMRKKIANAAGKISSGAPDFAKTQKKEASKSRSPNRYAAKAAKNNDEPPAWYGALKQNLGR